MLTLMLTVTLVPQVFGREATHQLDFCACSGTPPLGWDSDPGHEQPYPYAGASEQKLKK